MSNRGSDALLLGFVLLFVGNLLLIVSAILRMCAE